VEPERRQITVLFADLVDFTAFSERKGEEAAFLLMRDLAKLMEEAVHEQSGVVQGFTGDGIMAVFGAPAALEDAPLRACRAALSILQKLKTSGADIQAAHGLRPQLRMGLNTGLAVVGTVQGGTGAAATALGDTVNVAARLQTLAEPDSVVISSTTFRLVQGLVETTFSGEHEIKGKADRQGVYKLGALRQGVTRFDVAVSRGLGAFVGRGLELEELERSLAEARTQLRVVDLVAEPGMGKSRLVHEFRQTIADNRAFVLSGSCSPESQQTSFFPLIEVVRGSFRIAIGEAEADVVQKIEMGLVALGLHSSRNLGLLLHLLGLKVPDGALTGLDGVLIGLRTRELLLQLLASRCRLSPVILVVEDLHWIDSVSQEVLDKLVKSEAEQRLLFIHTRRPEYKPPWLDSTFVLSLSLDPLPGGDIRRLIQTRLGVAALPEALAREVVDKAEGNPLFAEEIVSFLGERGVVRLIAGKVEFDSTALASALPATVESLLTARVDRLAAEDRRLLQAASVIGRRFDPDLLTSVFGEADKVEAQLAAMQAADLIHPEVKSNSYLFKHALVRDALYHSLLTEARTAMHLRIAEEIERRGGNRLTEVAEVLAYHYSQASRAKKAFAYSSMAGTKSLSVYSLEEATSHFTAALGLLHSDSDCASDDQVAEFLVSYTFLLNMTAQIKSTIDVAERYLPRIDRLLDDPRAVLIRHNYVFALLWNTRYRLARDVQLQSRQMAERLGDSRPRAYALTSEILFSTIVAPKPPHEFESLKRDAISAASDTADAHIQNWARFVVAWEEFHQGRMNDARDSARALMEVGQRLDDPRSTGLGLCVLALIAMLSDAYLEALEFSEQSISLAVTPFDRETALNIKGCVLALLRRTEEGLSILEAFRNRCAVDGDLYSLTTSDAILGVSKVIQGDISKGIRLLKEAISKRENEGYRAAADWYRLFLGEVYLQIIEGKEKVPLKILLRNLLTLLKVMGTASPSIRILMESLLANPRFHPDGYMPGRAHMLLGLLYKAKKRTAPALHHLTESRRILSQFGKTPILTRVDAALAELD
ncbi:MAG: AAA family ATPase, partial [Rhizobium sp.]|nr:AAA family ATPase [Rhizobium sp.]